jgi:hypothetical protein
MYILLGFIFILIIILFFIYFDINNIKIVRKIKGGVWYKCRFYSKRYLKIYYYWTQDYDKIPNNHDILDVDKY